MQFLFLLDATVHSYHDLAVGFLGCSLQWALYTPNPFLHSLEVLVLFCLLVLPVWDVFWQSPSTQVLSIVLQDKQLSVVLQFHTQSSLTIISAKDQLQPVIHSLDTRTQHAALVLCFKSQQTYPISFDAYVL